MTFIEIVEAIAKLRFADSRTKYDNFWLDTAYDWQTILTAVIAGVPAAIAAYLLWRQIGDQRSETQRTRQQQQIGARIKMPHALADLSDYWKHCFQAIVTEDLPSKKATLPNHSLELIMLAAPTVETETFEVIRKLVVSSQVFESRLRSAQARYTRSMIETLVVDVASLSFFTDCLYDFARFEKDKLQVTHPDRKMLSDQIFYVLDIDHRQCGLETKRLLVESALNRHFKTGLVDGVK